MEWFQKSTELGSPQANVSIGDMYYYGYGTNVSMKNALNNYEKAAKSGNKEAMIKLAELATDHLGSPPDFALERQWLEQAAEAGEPRAQVRLGDRLLHGDGGLEIDLKKARAWYEKAEQNRSLAASVRLGNLYRDGIGVNKDANIAEQKYLTAALGGSADGQAAIGDFYFRGLDGTPDYVKGFEWLQKASDQLHPDALLQLGIAHLTGEGLREAGISQDVRAASEWIHVSAERGNAEAREVIPRVDYDVCNKYDGIKCLPFPVYYITDRKDTRNHDDPYKRFADRLDDDLALSYGAAVVQIPISTTNINEIEPLWKSAWNALVRYFRKKAPFDPDPIILEVESVDGQDDFYNLLRSVVLHQKNPKNVPAILLFVHGYANSFSDSVRRAAKLADDLKFVGVPVIYSWGSENDVLAYKRDEKTIDKICLKFVDTLRRITTLNPEISVHIVAHSMGGKLVFNAMTACPKHNDQHFDGSVWHLAFAAPDIDQEDFSDRDEQITSRATRVTVYASMRDLPLKSESVFLRSGRPRVGQGGPALLVLEHIDSIDASPIESDGPNHAYVFSHPTVTSDLHQMLLNDLDPNRRTCPIPEFKGELPYWVMRAGC